MVKKKGRRRARLLSGIGCVDDLTRSIESLEDRRLLTIGLQVLDVFPESVPAVFDEFTATRVVFDAPVDLPTFTSDDIELLDPWGKPVDDVTITLVPDTHDTTFDLRFPPQTLRGEYRLAIGPDVSDSSGGLMNQDNDSLSGETNDQDVFHATINYRPAPLPIASGNGELFVEQFEDWSSIPSHWSFSTIPGATLGVTGSEGTHDGISHLRSTASYTSGRTQAATLIVDLSAHSGRDDLFLDFWVKRVAGASQNLAVQLSGDGRTWWEATRASVTGEYNHFVIDIDEITNRRNISVDGDVYVRFQHNSFSNDQGLVIDDVRLAVGPPQVTLSIPGVELLENSGTNAVMATVARVGALDTSEEVLVTLSSSDLSELAAPETVRIPAGATFVRFPLDVVDDALLDGSQAVTITAAAPGYGGDSKQLAITDHEFLTVDIVAEAIGEQGGSTDVIISRSNIDDLTQPLSVHLTLDDNTEITLPDPSVVTIAADEQTVTVPIEAIDDGVVDGVQAINITATAAGYESGGDLVYVQDGQGSALVLDIPIEMAREQESNSAITATLRRTGELSGDLEVNLEVSPVGQVILPASITIPDGQQSASFELYPVNDGVIDGSSLVTVTAYVGDFGLLSSTDIITVLDDDVSERLTLGGALHGHLELGEYDVLDTVTINRGDSLELTPGSTLRFSADTGINVAGRLLANGERRGEIRFVSLSDLPSPGDWNGISYSSTGEPRSILNNVEIAYATTGLNITPSGNSPAITLSNSFVHHNSADGVFVRPGLGNYHSVDTVVVEGSRISDNGQSGIVYTGYASGCSGSSSQAAVYGNEIDNNGHHGIVLGGSGSSVVGCIGRTFSGSVGGSVVGNFIHDNPSSGIVARAHHGYFTRGSVSTGVRNNLLWHNGQDGVTITGDGSQASAITNNTFAENSGAGIRHAANLGTLRNNVAVGNAIGIQAIDTFAPAAGAVSHNLLFANTNGNFIGYPPAYGELTTTNRNGTPSDAQFNIFADPLFAEPDDFHLLTGSPAIDAGTDLSAPNSDFDGNVRTPALTPVDIGFDEAGDRTSKLDGHGGTYVEEFDITLSALPTTGAEYLPPGWVAVLDSEAIRTITGEYPSAIVGEAVYDVGKPDSTDRGLALGITGETDLAELQFTTQITNDDASAIRLAFDLEVWAADPLESSNPGEAAFDIVVEMHSPNTQDFDSLFRGQVSTGATLVPPEHAGQTGGLFVRSTAVPIRSDIVNLASGDFNRDGHLDIVTGGLGSNIRILFGDSDGSFRVTETLAVEMGGVSNDTRPILVVDTDMDGDSDIVVANKRSSSLSFLVNQGDGTFADQYIVPVGQQPIAMTGEDLDGDNDFDIALITVSGDGTVTQLVVLTNGRNDGWSPPRLVGIEPTLAMNPPMLAAADFTADGINDLLVSSSDGMLHVIPNNGDGTFAEAVTTNTGETGMLAVGDLNGDSLTDVAIVHDVHGASQSTTAGVSAFIGQPDGSFTLGDEIRFGSTYSPAWIAIADVNNDGDLDIATTYASANRLWVMLGNGDGTVAAPQSHETLRFPRALLPADLDGDGDLDLAVANQGPDSVSIFENVATILDGNAPVNQIHFDSGNLPVDIPSGSELRIRFVVPDNVAAVGYIFGLDNFELRTIATGDVTGDGHIDALDFAVVAGNLGIDDPSFIDGDTNGDEKVDEVDLNYVFAQLEFEPQAGDANLDRVFEQRDIVLILQGAKYLSGESAIWSEGDWNGDDVFNQDDLVAALQTGNYLNGPYAIQKNRSN